jgi:hypothetical protein
MQVEDGRVNAMSCVRPCYRTLSSFVLSIFLCLPQI